MSRYTIYTHLYIARFFSVLVLGLVSGVYSRYHRLKTRVPRVTDNGSEKQSELLATVSAGDSLLARNGATVTKV